jgi:hypothetical protein
MKDLTEEEYDALDEYYTKNPPKIDPTRKGTGFFSQRMAANETRNNKSADYPKTKTLYNT